MRLLSCALIASAYLLQSSPSSAAIYACLDQESSCISEGAPASIYIYDEIDNYTAEKFFQYADRIPESSPFPIVYVNTYGGSVAAAMEIAKVLRARNAKVEGKDFFFPDHQHICLSACVMMSAGGVERNLTNIGLHRMHTQRRIKGDLYERLAEPYENEMFISEFYDKMGLPKELFDEEMKVPFDQLREINLDLDKDYESQEIVKLGFRTRKPSTEEIASLKRVDKLATKSAVSLEYAALKGDMRAAHLLGTRYFVGLNMETKSVEKGLYWLNYAADLNNLGSLHLLGVIYSNGYGGEVNRTLASEFYRKAAKLGFSSSQNNLGWHYYEGLGVEKNLSEAIFWITRSVEQGEPFAYDSLGQILLEGNGFIQDDVETYKWLRLGQKYLPEGSSKEGNSARLATVRRKMTEDQIRTAELLVEQWKPLKQTRSVMRDKDDR